MTNEEEQLQIKIAIKLFTSKVSKAKFKVIPTDHDIAEAERVLNRIASFATRVADSDGLSSHMQDFTHCLVDLLMLAEIGLGALTAMNKLAAIEELREALLKREQCPEKGCILKRGHPDSCILNNS